MSPLLARALVLAVALTACGHEAAPPAAPDPCIALRARHETALARGSCTTDAECVPAPTIDHATPPERMGADVDDEEPCTPATHRDSMGAVEASVRAFEAAGCGRVIPVHTHCGDWGHGQHITCVDHACSAGY